VGVLAFTGIPLAGCDDGEPVDPGPPPTLAEVQAEVFTKSCVFTACHKGGAPAGKLSLEPGEAFANLVNTPVIGLGAEGRTRVVPSDVDASYIMEKLTSGAPTFGDQMPPTLPLEADRLDMVRRWIADGAQDN
jgi:hypothetical protein